MRSGVFTALKHRTGWGTHVYRRSSAIIGYQSEVISLTDLLIRDVSDEVVAALDASAKRLGLSRSEYLRRQLMHDARVRAQAVTVADLSWFAETFSDLGDADVVRRAWR